MKQPYFFVCVPIEITLDAQNLIAVNLLNVIAQLEHLFKAKVTWLDFHQQEIHLLINLGST